MTANGPKIQFGTKLVNKLIRGERNYSHSTKQVSKVDFITFHLKEIAHKGHLAHMIMSSKQYHDTLCTYTALLT